MRSQPPMESAFTQSAGVWMRALPDGQSVSPLLPTAIAGRVMPSEKSWSSTAVQAWTSLSSIGRSGPRLRVDEVVFRPRFEHVLNALQHGVELLLVVLQRVLVEHAVVVDARVRAVGGDAVLQRPEQEC